MLFLKLRRVLIGAFLIFLCGFLCDEVMDFIFNRVVGSKVLLDILHRQLWYSVYGYDGFPGFLSVNQAWDIQESWMGHSVSLDLYERFISGNIRLTVFMEAASYSASWTGVILVGVVTFFSALAAVLRHVMPSSRQLWNKRDAAEEALSSSLGIRTVPLEESDRYEDMVDKAFGEQAKMPTESKKTPLY